MNLNTTNFYTSKEVVIFPVPVNIILESFRQIVQEEIMAERNKRETERMLSPAEACRLFDPPISKPTLAAWTKKGWLRDYRIGCRVFYKSKELMEGLKTLKRYKNK